MVVIVMIITLMMTSLAMTDLLGVLSCSPSSSWYLGHALRNYNVETAASYVSASTYRTELQVCVLIAFMNGILIL